MSEPIIPIEQIKAHARAAAERGEKPNVCEYLKGSSEEYDWKDAFYVRWSQLMPVKVAA